MRISSFRYLLKTGLKSLWHNRLMTLASIGTLVACLLIVGLAVLFSINIDSIIEYLGEQNEVVVFLQTDAPETAYLDVQSEMESLGSLGEITYISKAEALESIVDKYLSGDEGLLSGMDNSFLPESFRAKILKPDEVDSIVAALKRIDYVEEVEAPTQLTKTLVSMRSMVNTFGFAVVGALILVSIVIVTNTIRASVFSRRREINIMKYVGANNTFIRVPFVAEGIVLGIIAALLAFFLVWGGYTAFYTLIREELTGWIGSAVQHLVPFGEIATQILAYFLLSGMFVGGIGSGFSMRKYLRV